MNKKRIIPSITYAFVAVVIALGIFITIRYAVEPVFDVWTWYIVRRFYHTLNFISYLLVFNIVRTKNITRKIQSLCALGAGIIYTLQSFVLNAIWHLGFDYQMNYEQNIGWRDFGTILLEDIPRGRNIMRLIAMTTISLFLVFEVDRIIVRKFQNIKRSLVRRIIKRDEILMEELQSERLISREEIKGK